MQQSFPPRSGSRLPYAYSSIISRTGLHTVRNPSGTDLRVLQNVHLGPETGLKIIHIKYIGRWQRKL